MKKYIIVTLLAIINVAELFAAVPDEALFPHMIVRNYRFTTQDPIPSNMFNYYPDYFSSMERYRVSDTDYYIPAIFVKMITDERIAHHIMKMDSEYDEPYIYMPFTYLPAEWLSREIPYYDTEKNYVEVPISSYIYNQVDRVAFYVALSPNHETETRSFFCHYPFYSDIDGNILSDYKASVALSPTPESYYIPKAYVADFFMFFNYQNPRLGMVYITTSNLTHFPDKIYITETIPELSLKSIEERIYTEQGSGEYLSNRQIYNSMGGIDQIIQVNASPSGKDIIIPKYYDRYQRETRNYLPYSTELGESLYDTIPFESQFDFYSDIYGVDDAGYAYSELIYEASPLNRPEGNIGIGKVYRKNKEIIRSDHRYQSNTANDMVLNITVNSDNTGFSSNGYFADRSLFKNVSLNEDGHRKENYVDASGDIIMTRSILNESAQNIDTYFIYDKNKCLAYVINPEGAASIKTFQNYSDTSVVCMQHCFVYKFDWLNRTIAKRLPGKAWEYMVYDRGGRLILYQDAIMRADRRWIYTVYDNRDRIFTTYMISSQMSHSALIGLYDNFQNRMPVPAPVNMFIPAGADFSLVATLSEYKYGVDVAGLPSYLSFSAVSGIVVQSDIYDNTSGMLVYEKTYLVDDALETSAPNYVERTYYYDARGRIIQTEERNHLGGISRYSTKYDFTGNVLTRYESHQRAGNAAEDNLTRTYTYDRRSRLLSETTTLNSSAPAVVTYNYTELGQLASQTYGTGMDAITDTLTYNIQGWLTDQSNNLFDMKMEYFNPKHAAPLFSGNIAEWTWQHKDMRLPENTYAFSYDKLGRLTNADHYEGVTKTGRFREQIQGYDLNGNIGMIDRSTDNGMRTYINDYEGNRLSKVTTAGGEHSYTYDANGNCMHDGLNNLDLQYNYLNLICNVHKDNRLMASYSWCADGMKTGVVDADGNGYEYLGSLIYKRTGGQLALESAGFGAGRIIRSEASGGDVYTANYFITDHLGSTRAVVAGGERVQTNDYYPFGLRWDNAGSLYSDNRFLYNGKESQSSMGINYLDFGFRMYDPTLGIWHSMDPKAGKYSSHSPYHYVGGNPIMFIDPNGDDYYFNEFGNFLGEYGSRDFVRIIDNDTWVNDITFTKTPLIPENLEELSKLFSEYDLNDNAILEIFKHFYKGSFEVVVDNISSPSAYLTADIPYFKDKYTGEIIKIKGLEFQKIRLNCFNVRGNFLFDMGFNIKNAFDHEERHFWQAVHDLELLLNEIDRELDAINHQRNCPTWDRTSPEWKDYIDRYYRRNGGY